MHNDSFVTIINIVNLEKQLCLSMSISNLKSCYQISQEIYMRHLILLIYFRKTLCEIKDFYQMSITYRKE